jgi:hypothetical protein
LPHTAARLVHLELLPASASHAPASNFDKLTEAELLNAVGMFVWCRQ